MLTLGLCYIVVLIYYFFLFICYPDIFCLFFFVVVVQVVCQMVKHMYFKLCVQLSRVQSNEHEQRTTCRSSLNSFLKVSQTVLSLYWLDLNHVFIFPLNLKPPFNDSLDKSTRIFSFAVRCQV